MRISAARVRDEAQRTIDILFGGGKIVYDDSEPKTSESVVFAVRCPHCDEMFEIELDPQELTDDR